MDKKVLLILCDGMRPDGLEKANHPFYQKFKSESAYTMNGTTVMPSVTLPCHMSLFHSVDPVRHGVMTNTYTPQVRPIDGLCEQLRKFDKKCAMFYNWEELKDITRPDSMTYTCYYSGHTLTHEVANEKTAQTAKAVMADLKPDFAFLYFGIPDEKGHSCGWMTDEYINAIKFCWDKIEEVCSVLSDEYTVIVTADHGGHERTHGTEMPEDMTIPVLFRGSLFESGAQLENVNIKDIAPTVTSILGVPANADWEGKSIV